MAQVTALVQVRSLVKELSHTTGAVKNPTNQKKAAKGTEVTTSHSQRAVGPEKLELEVWKGRVRDENETETGLCF